MGSWMQSGDLEIPSSSFCGWTKSCKSQRKDPLTQKTVTIGERGATGRLKGKDLRRGHEWRQLP